MRNYDEPDYEARVVAFFGVAAFLVGAVMLALKIAFAIGILVGAYVLLH